MVRKANAVRMTGITKRFGALAANEGVDFELRPGEIHALLGENGAGKSTLMNILSGLYRADAGTVEVEGRLLALTSPREALAAGIGMVHQHFMLVKGHTVAENMILGLREPRFYLDTAAINDRISALGERYHLPVDPRARIWQLSMGERQRVEILKLLYRGARVLIMDEPTAVLTPREVEQLFDTLRELRASGCAIVFISHKLEEVLAVSDRITVLRGGRKVATLPAAGVSPQELAAMMVGEIAVPEPPSATACHLGGREALVLEGVRARNDRGLTALKDVSLSVSRGEIFGLLGVAGNGQKELAEVATGLRRPSSGRIVVDGVDLTGQGPRRFISSGVAHIPEDRLGTGIAASMTLAENLLMKSFRARPCSRGPFLRLGAMEEEARRLIAAYGIQPADPWTRAGTLSGGNLQRLILARELSGTPCLLVAAYPFQGLDVAATEFLARVLKERAREGLAVLLIGEDLEQTLGMSDRVAVIFEGKIGGGRPSSAVRREELGLMMAGHGLREAGA